MKKKNINYEIKLVWDMRVRWDGSVAYFRIF